jgi:hypothetical protein
MLFPFIGLGLLASLLSILFFSNLDWFFTMLVPIIVLLRPFVLIDLDEWFDCLPPDLADFIDTPEFEIVPRL